MRRIGQRVCPSSVDAHLLSQPRSARALGRLDGGLVLLRRPATSCLLSTLDCTMIGALVLPSRLFELRLINGHGRRNAVQHLIEW